MTQRNRVIWQYQDLSSDPSSSSRIIFAVFRNLYLILNWWTTQREAHAISINPNGRIWKMVLCLPGDHIKNHTMQVQGKSTVMPLLRVINKNLTICISVFCNNNDFASSSKNKGRYYSIRATCIMKFCFFCKNHSGPFIHITWYHLNCQKTSKGAPSRGF